MKENKTTAVEAKCAISVKNTYDNTKRFTIALWMLNKGVLGFANPPFYHKDIFNVFCRSFEKRML